MGCPKEFSIRVSITLVNNFQINDLANLITLVFHNIFYFRSPVYVVLLFLNSILLHTARVGSK